MGLVRTVPPATEPLSRGDAKKHLRISDSFTDDDLLVDALVSAARHAIEERCRRSLITQTWQLTMDQWPGPTWVGSGWSPLAPGLPPLPPGNPTSGDLRRKWYGIPLERGPIQSVSSVKYVEGSGATVTMDPATYEVDTTREIGRIVPLAGGSWPGLSTRLNAVTVKYVCGFGDAMTDMPSDLMAALKLIIGDLYENRESQMVGNFQILHNPTVDALLTPYLFPEAA